MNRPRPSRLRLTRKAVPGERSVDVCRVSRVAVRDGSGECDCRGRRRAMVEGELMDEDTSIKGWRALLVERQLKEIEFSEIYTARFSHGTDGHNAKQIIAKLSEMLDRVEASGVDIQSLYHPEGG